MQDTGGEHVSFMNVFGMVMYGAPSFVERQREILSTFFKGTTKRHQIRRIRFVSPTSRSWTSTTRCAE